MKSSKSYAELISFDTFDERLNYLLLHGKVGHETFGSRRYLNQSFYSSSEWRKFRRDIIIRDNGCDLGLPGYEIQGRAIVHHIVPLTIEQVTNNLELLMDANNVILVSYDTHNAIHYGISNPYPMLEERFPNDTCPWRR